MIDEMRNDSLEELCTTCLVAVALLVWQLPLVRNCKNVFSNLRLCKIVLCRQHTAKFVNLETAGKVSI